MRNSKPRLLPLLKWGATACGQPTAGEGSGCSKSVGGQGARGRAQVYTHSGEVFSFRAVGWHWPADKPRASKGGGDIAVTQPLRCRLDFTSEPSKLETYWKWRRVWIRKRTACTKAGESYGHAHPNFVSNTHTGVKPHLWRGDSSSEPMAEEEVPERRTNCSPKILAASLGGGQTSSRFLQADQRQGLHLPGRSLW